jgi:AcrR family transcriptional regulator
VTRVNDQANDHHKELDPNARLEKRSWCRCGPLETPKQVGLGFQATTLDKVAHRAKISKLSIYRHFENKEVLFGAAFAARGQQSIPQALFEGVDGSAEDQLMAVGSSLLRTLLRPDVRNVEAMVMADAANQKSLSKVHYEAGPAHIIAQIEALLRQLHAKAALNVPDPLRSARLFAALLKGSDLLIIARFDEAKAEDDNEIESYCRSAVAMFIAAHGGNDHAGGLPGRGREGPLA